MIDSHPAPPPPAPLSLDDLTDANRVGGDQPTHSSARFRGLDPAKRAAVLAAASAEFAAHGYRAASTNRIAAAARVSKGALFSYFPAKDDLFAAVVEDLFAFMQTEAVRIAAVGSSRGLFAALRESALSALSFHRRAPQLFTIYTRLLDRGDDLPERTPYLSRYQALSRGLYLGLLDEARTRGELAPDVSREAGLLLVDATLRRLYESLVDPSARPDGAQNAPIEESTYERWVDSTMHLLERALTRKAA